MTIIDYKKHITMAIIGIAILGLGTYKVIHFLNTGVSQSANLQLSSQKKTQSSTSSALNTRPITSKPTIPTPITSSDPYNSSYNTGGSSPVPSSSYTYTPPTTTTTNTQQVQACQQEQTAQANAIAPYQSQINQLQSQIQTTEQQINNVTGMDGQPLPQYAKDELSSAEVVPIMQQQFQLQDQENATRSQYPTPDCS